MDKLNELLGIIIEKLQEDYRVAKNNNLHLCFDMYNDLLYKAVSMNITEPIIEKSKVEDLVKLSIEELDIYMGNGMNGTYIQAQNRLCMLDMQLDLIKGLIR